MPKLSTVAVEGFKSWGQATLAIHPLTLLIGPNASGKTNLLEALRFLRWAAQGGRLDQITRALREPALGIRGSVGELLSSERGGCRAQVVTRASSPYRWIVDLGLDTAQEMLRVRHEALRDTASRVPLLQTVSRADGLLHDIAVSYDNFARGGIKPQIRCTDQQLVITQVRSPASFGPHHQRARALIPAVCADCCDSLSEISFLDPQPAAMRGYGHVADAVLGDAGENLSGVLKRLAEAGHNTAVLDFVRHLPEQAISGLSFAETDRGEVMVQLRERAGRAERVVDAPVLSDGTLRVLAIAAAVLGAPPGSLLVIEEIDNGIHPSRLRDLLARLIDVATQRDLGLLATTHNPALLDALPLDALPWVQCCYRDPETGESALRALPEVPSYPVLLAQGDLGQVVSRGQLEAALRQPPRPGTERAGRAAALLAEWAP